MTHHLSIPWATLSSLKNARSRAVSVNLYESSSMNLWLWQDATIFLKFSLCLVIFGTHLDGRKSTNVRSEIYRCKLWSTVKREAGHLGRTALHRVIGCSMRGNGTSSKTSTRNRRRVSLRSANHLQKQSSRTLENKSAVRYLELMKVLRMWCWRAYWWGIVLQCLWLALDFSRT